MTNNYMIKSCNYNIILILLVINFTLNIKIKYEI